MTEKEIQQRVDVLKPEIKSWLAKVLSGLEPTDQIHLISRTLGRVIEDANLAIYQFRDTKLGDNLGPIPRDMLVVKEYCILTLTR